jgi:hypothetical protein
LTEPVHTAHGGARADAGSERVPKGQRADQDQQARQKNGDQAERGSRQAMRRGRHDSAQVGRKAEQRSRNGLCSGISREERALADPTGDDEGIAQQGQHHVAAPEHQRTGTVEGVD